MIKTKRKPDSVGGILKNEFMAPLGLTQDKLAQAMMVGRKTVNELCRNKRSVTADTALRLGKVFNNSPQFWMNIQVQNDLWESTQDQERMNRLEELQPFPIKQHLSQTTV